MNINPNQFQSAGELPVYQGGINTGTNWGENTGFSTGSVGDSSQQEDFNSGGINLPRRPREKNPRDMNLNPNYGWAVVPALAAAALGSQAKDTVANLGAGILGRIKEGVGAADRVVGTIPNAVQGAAGKAKSMGGEVLGAASDLLKGTGDIGNDVIGASIDQIGGAAHFLSNVSKNLGQQFSNLAIEGVKRQGELNKSLANLYTSGWEKAFDARDVIGEKAIEGVKFTAEAVKNIPSNLDKLYQEHIGSPSGGTMGGSSTVPAAGAGAAAGGAAAPVPPVIPYLDLANQMLQIYYD